MATIRPPVKWAGGKAKIAKHVLSRLPAHIDTYYEPMCGGGFILFQLAQQGRFRKAVINDSNPELINMYRVIKRDVEGLIDELRCGRYQYDRKLFLEIRADKTSDLSEIQRAARFIYLTKTCFNGLYRVNQKGEFNTPFGKYDNPTICDEPNLREVSRVLKKVKILNTDFEKACAGVCELDAVYFDPPYLPLSKTSSFTSYTTDRFDMNDHIRLQQLFRQLSDIPVRVVLSNSSAPEALDLYRDFDMDLLDGTRCIGGPTEYRNSVKEILVFAGPRC